MVKKILWTLLILIFLAVGGIAIFIATFDVNRYRPLIVQKIEQATGRKVQIGKLALSFSGGLGITMDGVSVSNPDGSSFLETARLRTSMEWGPLLKKQLEISSLEIDEPHIILTKAAMPEAGPGAPAKGETAAEQPSLEIRLLRIKDGTVEYRMQPGKAITVSRIDLTVQPFSLSSRSSAKGSLAIFSKGEQNVSFSGDVMLSGKPITAENVRIDLRLDSLNLAEIAAWVPAVKGYLNSQIAGSVSVLARRLAVPESGLPDYDVSAELQNGIFRKPGTLLDFEALQAQIDLKKDNIVVRNISTRFAQGTLKGQGALTGAGAAASETFDLSVENISLQAVAPQARFQGLLSGTLKGTSRGLDRDTFLNNLRAEGQMQLSQSRWMGFNLLKQVFDKLSVVPGIAEDISSRLPPAVQTRIQQPDTVFAPFQAFFRVQDGRVFLPDLRIASQDFAVGASADVGLNGTIRSKALLQISGAISQAAVQSVPQLSFILNNQGLIEVPVTIEGPMRSPAITADVNYIASRFATTQGAELLAGLLKKGLK